MRKNILLAAAIAAIFMSTFSGSAVAQIFCLPFDTPPPGGIVGGQTIIMKNEKAFLPPCYNIGPGFLPNLAELLTFAGEIDENLKIGEGAEVTICGGQIGRNLTLEGGSFGTPQLTSSLDMYGGEGWDMIRAIQGNMTIFGRDFRVAGVPQNLQPGQSALVSQRGGATLRGCFSDGNEFQFDLKSDSIDPQWDFIADPPASFGNGVNLRIMNTTETVDDFTVFRGSLAGGGLPQLINSDNSRLRMNPGFTINNTEAPVWLIFDANIHDIFDDPAVATFFVESQAGTPGLEYTVEMFNWNTNAYEELGVKTETFNNDTVEKFNFNDRLDDFVDSAGAVRARVGWRQVGFTINFPWEVRVDQVGWTTGCPQ